VARRTADSCAGTRSWPARPGAAGGSLRRRGPGPRAPFTSNVVVEHDDAARPAPSWLPSAFTYTPSGPHCTVWVRLYPLLRKTASGPTTLHDLAAERILGVDHGNARRAQARHDHVATLHVRMRRSRPQRRQAGVPAKLVRPSPAFGIWTRSTIWSHEGEPRSRSSRARASGEGLHLLLHMEVESARRREAPMRVGVRLDQQEDGAAAQPRRRGRGQRRGEHGRGRSPRRILR
jgi:hypothetical protein